MRAAADREDATKKDNVTPGAIIPPRELLGELLLVLKQPDAALREFEQSLTRTPNRRNALSHAAKAAEQAGDKEKARNYEEQLRRLTASS